MDGFRFDEGTVLTRDPDGAPMRYPPIVSLTELADQLGETKLIAEAWDAGGLYEVGSFSGRRWSEWNGRFRDDMRRFVRGDAALVGKLDAAQESFGIQRPPGSPWTTRIAQAAGGEARINAERIAVPDIQSGLFEGRAAFGIDQGNAKL